MKFLFQTLELRSYLKSLGAEISEENSEGGLHIDLQNIIEASDICWKEIKDETGDDIPPNDRDHKFKGQLKPDLSVFIVIPPQQSYRGV